MTLQKAALVAALMAEALRESVVACWAASGAWRVSFMLPGLPSHPGAALRGLLAWCCRWGWGFGVMVMMTPPTSRLDARAADYPIKLVGNWI